MKQFKWLNKQGVESPGKFILQSVHRFFYHYIEGKNIYRINTEPCFSKEGKNKGYYEKLNFNSIALLDGDEVIEISEEEKDRISKNISNALNFMNIKHHFE